MIFNCIFLFFNWYGLSIFIDIVCLSLLVVIYYVFKFFKELECEMVLVGGISVLFILIIYI